MDKLRQILTKVRYVVWGTTPSSPIERKLLLKIDWFVLSFVCLNYWINYVDRSNLANAYVSGMQQDLNMKGDQYNIINTCFTVGYIVGMIPNNIMLLKVQPRYWMSFCALCWGVLTLSIYKASSYRQICVIRFFQAIFESSTFSGTHLILGSWYKEEELAKRSAIFTSSGLAGSIISSVMQAAIYKHMDGTRGLAGWRWLFIIDFIITIPIIIYGFICFPNTPENCNPLIFNEEEKQLALARVPPRAETKLDWSIIKRVVGSWHWWMFSLLWVFGGENESYATNSLFALWLKHYNYPVSDRNYFPMGVYAVGIVTTCICAVYSDHTKKHWHVSILISVVLVISSIMLLSNPLSKKIIFVAHYLSGVAYAGQATFFVWANIVTHNDLEERAVVLASMNMFSGAVNAWWSLIFYAADTVPKFKKGCYAMIATTIVTAFIGCAIRWLQLREDKLKVGGKSEVLKYHDVESGIENSSIEKNQANVVSHSIAE